MLILHRQPRLHIPLIGEVNWEVYFCFAGFGSTKNKDEGHIGYCILTGDR